MLSGFNVGPVSPTDAYWQQFNLCQNYENLRVSGSAALGPAANLAGGVGAAPMPTTLGSGAAAPNTVVPSGVSLPLNVEASAFSPQSAVLRATTNEVSDDPMIGQPSRASSSIAPLATTACSDAASQEIPSARDKSDSGADFIDTTPAPPAAGSSAVVNDSAAVQSLPDVAMLGTVRPAAHF